MIQSAAPECIKILLVEDQPGDALLTQTMLSEAAPNGFMLTHVSSIRRAVQNLKEGPCDVVLLDLSLPDTCGLETVNSILEVAPSVPIVVLSGLSNERLAIQSMQQGAQDYLIKGQVDGNLLLRTVCFAIERKRLVENARNQAEVLEQCVQELEQMDKTKNEFVSFVAHELKTPMIVAALALGRLESENAGSLNDEQKQLIGMLQRNISRVTALVNGVLNLSYLKAGRIQLAWTEVDLHALLVEAACLLAPLAQDRRGVVRTQELEAPLRVRCDPDKVIQILVNLASNSFKHNECGTTVVMGVRQSGTRAQIGVHDDGKGIAKHEHAKLFRPFGQITTDSGGRISGLGLAISKALVEAHGGNLLLISDEGEGCTFSFDLEAAGATAAEHAKPELG